MKEIKVFTSSTCPYCTSVKEYFKEKGIDYEELNVSSDPEARKELMSQGFMGVPVIIIDGEAMVGFDKEKLDEIFK